MSTSTNKWPKRPLFIFVAIMHTMAFGTVTESPYEAYLNKYSAGLYVIESSLCFAIFGLAVMYIEGQLGQWLRGPIRMWRILPLTRFVGWIICLLLVLPTAVYYSAIVSHSLHYIQLFASGEHWVLSICNEQWNIQGSCCDNDFCLQKTIVVANESFDFDFKTFFNWSSETNKRVSHPAEDYYDNYFAPINNAHRLFPVELDTHKITLVLVLMLISFACLSFGPISLGYFSIPILAVQVIIPLIFAVNVMSLPGAQDEMWRLRERGGNYAKIWLDASWNAIYTTSAGLMVWSTLASYNKNRYQWLWIDYSLVLLARSLASLLWIIITCGAYGFVASTRNVAVENIAETGQRFIYVTLPEVIVEMKQSGAVGTSVYIAVLFAGLSGLLPIIEVLNASLSTIFDYEFIKRHLSKLDRNPSAIRPLISAINCFFIFCLSLLFCGKTNGLTLIAAVNDFLISVSVVFFLAEVCLFYFTAVYRSRQRQPRQTVAALRRRNSGRLRLAAIIVITLIGIVCVAIGLRYGMIIYDGSESQRVKYNFSPWIIIASPALACACLIVACVVGGLVSLVTKKRNQSILAAICVPEPSTAHELTELHEYSAIRNRNNIQNNTNSTINNANQDQTQHNTTA